MDSSPNPSVFCPTEDDADPSQQRRYNAGFNFVPKFELIFIKNTFVENAFCALIKHTLVILKLMFKDDDRQL